MSNPIGTVWTVVIFGLLCLCVFVRLAERRSPRRILLPFRAGGWLERIALFLLVAYAAYVGGSKPGGLRIPVVPEGGGIPVEVAVIPTNRYLAGFVRTEARFGEAFDFSVPAGVQAYPFWRSRGAFEDVFRLPLPSVRAFGGNAFVTNAYVFPSGIIALSLPPVSSAVRTNEDERGTTAFAPFSAPLGFAPESFDRPGAFWSDATPSNSLRFTWLNALLHRETNAPVSFQAELFQNGDFIYRYDLSALTTQTLDGVTVGAWNAGVGDWFAPTSPALSSVRWHRLSIGDLVTPDRDGDGVPTASELLVYRTDPDLPDTDGDGIPDGAEITAGLDPLLRDTDADGLVEGSDPDPLTPTPLTDADGDGIPDAYEEFWFGGTGMVNVATNRDATGFTLAGKILAGINPTNGVAEASAVSTNGPVTWKLLDGFAADWPAGGTNLVWERTFPVNRSSAWQQFFISAAPTNAAGWSLSGMVLEWDAGNGTSGSAASSPFGDSFRIPLPTNALPSVLTLRLRADAAGLVRSPSPLYLIAYSPEFRISGEEVTGLSGARFLVFTEGADSQIELVIDHSLRPCKASPGDGECDAGWLEGLSSCDPDVSFDGDATGGTIRAARPGIYTLPAFPPSVAIPDPMRPASGGNGGVTLAVLSPSVWWRCDGHGCTYDGLEYDWEEGLYHEEDYYPLDSKCLRKKWYRDRDGGWIDSACELSVTSGLGDDGDLVTTSADGDTGRVYVDGVEVWSGTAAHAYGESGGGGYSEDFLGDGCDECDTDCADGNCDSLEGTTLGSLKFRIPLGAPARGQVSGFVWFASDGPVRVSKSTFRLLRHPAANVTETEVSGTRRIVCQDPRGRDLRIEDITNGVRITIYETAAQTLEHTWEIVNVEGNPSQVRLRKISRLNNVMSDETYTCSGFDWIRLDNISGTETRLTTYDDFADFGDGIKIEMCETTNAVGRTLSSVMTHKSRVGECGNAVLRETYRQEWTGTSVKWSHADYWNDPSHSARHGQPRLVQGNARAWVYTDFDEAGRETLRIEQRGNAEVPADFPYVVSNELCNASALADAFVTVRDYEPSAEDSCHPDDAAYPRTETRSVVTNGVAILIGCTRTRYTRLMRDGYAAVKKETWRDLGGSPSLATAAYSYEITYADTGDNTPLLMRNAVAETLDEDGILTVNAYTLSGGVLSCARRRYSSSAGGAPSTATAFPTYEVTERDASYGTLLRRMTRLTDGDTITADEQSIYDNKNRLRSMTYLDGTSLTNAYSCCRLLWNRDREGRKVLRSAQTGTDHLYHATEDVWLANVSTNGGYRVIQHFSDALGRETNTVTYVGTTPGEAAVPIGEAALLPLQNAGGGQLAVATVTTSYPHGGSDYAIHTDERGKVTVSRTDIYSDHIETSETVFTNGVEVVKTKTRSYLGGGSSFRREWNAAPVPGGLPSPATAWTEEYRSTSYAADGKRIECVTMKSSDYPLVTNSISTYDLLGRLVTTARPGANGSLIVTSNAYDGTTSRIVAETTTGSQPIQYAYDAFGERVGTIQGNMSIWNRTSYETISQEVYWVVTTVRMTGSVTNTVRVQKTQLTGLSDACRRHTVEMSGRVVPNAPFKGTVTETTVSLDSGTGIETSVSRTNGRTPVVTRSIHGITLDQASIDGESEISCDAFGRNVSVAMSNSVGVTNRIDFLEYDQSGNVARRVTDLLDGRMADATAEYDMLNREVRLTDALGNEIATGYDPLGRTVSTDGDAYPLRSWYDTQGRKTDGFTTRDSGVTWDRTRWVYDPASGVNTEKVYADGSRIAYACTDNGKKTRTTWARGAWKENAYNERNLVSGTAYSGTDTPSLSYTYTDSAKTAAATLSDGTSYAYGYDDSLLCTNESVAVCGGTFTVERTYDDHLRGAETSVIVTNVRHAAKTRIYDSEDRVCGYALTNAAGRDVSVALQYAGSRLTNTVFTLPNGGTFACVLSRETGRPDLVVRRDYRYGADSVYWHECGFDLLGRPTNAVDSAMLVRAYGYNNRNELAFATSGTNAFAYAYDTIGNRTSAIVNSETNSYSANDLNQYTSILRASTPPREPTYDADGNLAEDGKYSYTYDAENRLVSVTPLAPVQGDLSVLNTYDHRHRRILKCVKRYENDEWVLARVHSFAYDGNNIVLERIMNANGETHTIENFWGNDLSGSEEGAGGVGGLLAVSVDGVYCFPCYDNNGNVMRYIGEDRSIVAQFTYDPYGNVIEQAGATADSLRIRFSTKYADSEVGVVSYLMRFYDPLVGRWLNRDPIEEDGGENLYAFCGNDPIGNMDFYGLLTKSFEIKKYNYTTSPHNFGEVMGGFSVTVDCVCKKAHADIWMHLSYYIADKNAPVWKGIPSDYPNEKVPPDWNSLSYGEKRNFIERHEDKHIYWYRIYFDAAVMLLANLEAHTFSSDRACQANADLLASVLNRDFLFLRDKKQKEHDELWEKLR